MVCLPGLVLREAHPTPNLEHVNDTPQRTARLPHPAGRISSGMHAFLRRLPDLERGGPDERRIVRDLARCGGALGRCGGGLRGPPPPRGGPAAPPPPPPRTGGLP